MMRIFTRWKANLAFLFLLTLITATGNIHAQNLTQAGFTSVLTPLYMSSGGSTRLPVMFRATVTGLTANTSYRYYTQAAITTDFTSTNSGAGNPLLINTAGNLYTYTSGPGLSTANGYETFTTDASGSYTGWFGFVNTGNARFTAGNIVYPSIVIGTTTGTILSRRALDSGITVLGYSNAAGANNGSFLKEVSNATAKNLVVIYDNTAGSGRPLYIAPVEAMEAVGAAVSNLVPAYSTAAGSWNAIIPNSNANGIRRIEQRNSITGLVVGCATDDDGVWGTVSTVNPTASSTGLTIAGADAPLNSCGPVGPNPNPPVILADNETIIDAEKTTTYLSIPDNSPVANPAAFVSGVLGDPTDPARTIGLEFNVSDIETAAGSLIVTALSSNTAVVTNANLTLTTGNTNSRNLKITPSSAGYADITVTVSDGSLTSSYVIKYAASAASTTPASTRFLTQASDASTAQAVDADFMLVADDEDQILRLYNRTNSGLPVAGFDYTTSLGLTDLSGGLPREVDIESSVKIGNRIYWLGSHGNASNGNSRPNRSRLFATDITANGASTTLSYVGRYDGLKTDLLDWDNANGNVLGFAASTAIGKTPEDPALDGFNIEGLTVAPDGTTGFIAFRAPNLPTNARTTALIVPWTNMTTLVSGNPSTGPATFGTPIQLDLGGRGIREIQRNAAGEYLILAGPADVATGTAPKDFRLFTWTGIATDVPVLQLADLTSLNAGGSFESIVDLPSPLTGASQVQLLVDNGDQVFYGDGIIAKDLGENNFQKFSSEIVTLGTAPVAATFIHDIQGSGNTATLTGVQTIEGIVTRTFLGTNGLNGFYVQEEDADVDPNPATSEGIFVYNVTADPAGLVTVSQGDKVRITGTVVDFVSTTSGVTTSLTELKTLTSVINLGTAPLPTVTEVKLPVANVSDLERYEGMLVNLSAATGNLAVTEYFQLGRYGQVVLAAEGTNNLAGTDARLDQFTQFNTPSVAGYAAYLAENAKRKIILDDGSGKQNPDPVIFGRGGNPLSAVNTLRGGDQVSNVTGILDERLEGYRIQTATGVNFTAANVRPVSPPSIGASATLTVGSANVLNYFTSLDLNVSGTDFRGANTAEEFTRQRTKVIKAMVGSGADVLGLMELQSNGATPTTALQDLINGLNAEPGSSGTYAFVDPAATGSSISTDAISVGIIYKTDKVIPEGSPATLTTSAAFDLVGRRPLAQTFKQIANSELFTVVVNHFKSKGSSAGAAGDADAGDGQGESNGTRTRQAQDLATWLATKPTGTADSDYLILGDLNAYAKEEPLTKLAAAGYNNLLPQTSYSYVFDGQVGSLDHALATSTLTSQVTGAEKWHINADEPSVLDYNTEFKSAGQITSFYNADHFRASDHDPVLIGLNLTKPLPVNYISFSGSSDHKGVSLKWETSEEKNNQGFDVLKSNNGSHFEKIGYVTGNATTSARSTYTFTDTDVQDSKVFYYRLEQHDFDGTSELSRIIGVLVKSDKNGNFVYPNPNQGNFTVRAANQDASSMKLFNNSGIEIPVNIRKTESSDSFSVEANHVLPAGVYYLQLQTQGSNEKQAIKVIVK
ncbi:ExeM/NucH family extracellular endonuclease [Dyadobacter diqingensis]|uniref:ExeM/NucH family extracellular endonuclease n=1 Tax=Dyadobacter diqingensis TaxID=2938121 RepID=UPI0020C1AAC7|nr:ExeM/NucH family extracellular endonuclease [Dyadobacter diqingensis]